MDTISVQFVYLLEVSCCFWSIYTRGIFRGINIPGEGLSINDVRISLTDFFKNSRENGSKQLCMSDSCPQKRKLSFTQEPDNEPGLIQGGAALILGTELLVPHVSDALMDAVNNIELDKPELTCISEEGIADMDLPDNILDELDFPGDCITSCNKVNFGVLFGGCS